MATKVIPIFGDKMRKVKERFDGFYNYVTGLGTGRDKMTYNRFQRSGRLDDETLDALYSEDDIAARVCDVVPEEELRKGYEINIALDTEDESGDALAETSAIAEDVHTAADELGLEKKIIEARVWARVFGGGALLLGADDGATKENGMLIEPLNENAIQQFDHINVLDKRYLHPNTYYDDPTDKKFGMPRTYLVTPEASSGAITASQATLEIHETRLVVFGGTRTTIRTRQENGGWNTSVLQRMNSTLYQFGVSWDALAHIIQDASQGVFKMRGYLDALAADDLGTIMARLDVMDMSRSIVRAVTLDADEGESFERQNFSWSGIRDVYEMLSLRLAASARMPVTILFGQSPAGMDATGDSDLEWFYGTIESSQHTEVKPALEYVLRLLMLSKSGPTSGKVPENWGVTFPELREIKPKAQAEIEKLIGDRDAAYIDRGILTPEEVATSRFTVDGWSMNTQINLEERRAILEGDIDIDDELDEPEPEPVTPTPEGEPEGEEIQKKALNGAQTTALVTVATGVQAGELGRESGIAIIMASNPSLDRATVETIVGEPDPEKLEAKVAAIRVPADAPEPDEDELEDIVDQTEIQTLIFSKEKYSAADAKKWAKNNKFKAGKVDETEDSIRLRQRAPADFERMRTIELKPGIKAVVGPLKK